MEQIENNGTLPEVQETEASVQETTNEQLEANETDNDNSTGSSEGDEGSLSRKLEELGISRQDYFKLKGKEGSQEGGESREEGSQQVASDDALLGRLEARGVMDVDDQDYVLKAAKTLGVSPIEALTDPVVMDRLSANQKARETAAATPSSANRSGQTSAKDSVEFWLSKPDTDLPPKESKELRRKVIHARNEQRSRNKMFNH